MEPRHRDCARSPGGIPAAAADRDASLPPRRGGPSASRPAPGTPGLNRLEGRIVASEWPVSAVVSVTVAP